MKVVRIHKEVARELAGSSEQLRFTVAELLDLLASGESLGMPVSRPMPVVETGAHELRVKDRSGQYRVFYYTKTKNALLVFHFFKKKTQATPKREIELAKKRLRSMK